MTSQAGKQITPINILPNVSKSKCDQTIKLRQLIEYEMRTAYMRAL